jgi:hypothetical protein
VRLSRTTYKTDGWFRLGSVTQVRRLPFDRTLAVGLYYCRRAARLNLIAPRIT